MSKRLGKGLDALIPSLSINDDDKIVEIPLSQLRANPYQPRKDFNEESIQELRSRSGSMASFSRSLSGAY
ncbi:Chromosome-partitioning protein Spo0J [Paenibacillus sp. P1XP2]|nr:Chromosome-partitioning protein Spo0J [Paenibacillus sp. P1XP2]